MDSQLPPTTPVTKPSNQATTTNNQSKPSRIFGRKTRIILTPIVFLLKSAVYLMRGFASIVTLGKYKFHWITKEVDDPKNIGGNCFYKSPYNSKTRIFCTDDITINTGSDPNTIHLNNKADKYTLQDQIDGLFNCKRKNITAVLNITTGNLDNQDAIKLSLEYINDNMQKPEYKNISTFKLIIQPYASKDIVAQILQDITANKTQNKISTDIINPIEADFTQIDATNIKDIIPEARREMSHAQLQQSAFIYSEKFNINTVFSAFEKTPSKRNAYINYIINKNSYALRLHFLSEKLAIRAINNGSFQEVISHVIKDGDAIVNNQLPIFSETMQQDAYNKISSKQTSARESSIDIGKTKFKYSFLDKAKMLNLEKEETHERTKIENSITNYIHESLQNAYKDFLKGDPSLCLICIPDANEIGEYATNFIAKTYLDELCKIRNDKSSDKNERFIKNFIMSGIRFFLANSNTDNSNNLSPSPDKVAEDNQTLEQINDVPEENNNNDPIIKQNTSETKIDITNIKYIIPETQRISPKSLKQASFIYSSNFSLDNIKAKKKGMINYIINKELYALTLQFANKETINSNLGAYEGIIYHAFIDDNKAVDNPFPFDSYEVKQKVNDEVLSNQASAEEIAFELNNRSFKCNLINKTQMLNLEKATKEEREKIEKTIINHASKTLNKAYQEFKSGTYQRHLVYLPSASEVGDYAANFIAKIYLDELCKLIRDDRHNDTDRASSHQFIASNMIEFCFN